MTPIERAFADAFAVVLGGPQEPLWAFAARASEAVVGPAPQHEAAIRLAAALWELHEAHRHAMRVGILPPTSPEAAP